MRSLFSLDDLSNEEIMSILKDADNFKNGWEYSLKGKVVANLFFEPSTRTEYSFIMAEELLDMKVIAFNKVTSSLQKGETFLDTIQTFEAFGVDAFVIRHSENEYYKQLQGLNARIINAGDGTGDHPTQTLLDLLTILQEYGHFNGLKIAFVGDIKHSRVAHGDIKAMKRLGMDCYISGPEIFKEDICPYIELDEAIKTMDIIMLLRVQVERHKEKLEMDNQTYLKNYGMTVERINAMKKTSIVMHPAPFNRGVELDEAILNNDKCRIFKQMKNGVYIRQSVIRKCFLDE